MSSTRHLAAIMFADIQGYTAIMEEDEVLAMELRDKFKSTLEREVDLHNGRIVKFSGDGALCIFDSAIESIKAALAVQGSMKDTPKVPLRIGIHQADIIFESGDVHGDGVNIASRLESFAIPGSVLISAKVYDDIKNQKNIQAVSLGKYLLKNVKEPVEIYAISNPGMPVPHAIKLEGKGVRFKGFKSSKDRNVKITLWLLPFLVLGIAAFLILRGMQNKAHARNVLIPQIQQLINENTIPTTQAFDLGMEADKFISSDSSLAKLWPTIATTINIETDPAGAEVFWKDYQEPAAVWRLAGVTPLKNLKFPRSFLRMEIRKAGYQTISYAGPLGFTRLGDEIAHLKLDTLHQIPENMVRVPGRITNMNIVGLEQHGKKYVGEFLIDKYEVTNSLFKAFMDAGGYTNKAFWQFPVYSKGKEIPLDSALTLFTDRTGRRAPATWEAGIYPDGQENYPVTGVSWYEAAAYAAYAHKQLPNIFQWSRVAATSRAEYIVPMSNFSGKSPVAVGSLPGYCSFGIYDLAGNAREWCLNERDNPGQRFILGGGWNDQIYSFNDGYSQNGVDRSTGNGFRCVKTLPGDTTLIALTQPLPMDLRDYRKEKPVDDKTFTIFLRQFDYDKRPLNPQKEDSIDNEFWTAEKISFDAGYNNERMEAYIFLPKFFKKPYQAILYSPGSGAIFSTKFNAESAMSRIDYILKSGRCLIYPIYKGTNERHDDLKSDLQNETVFYKEHVIMWRKDIGRTLDYLETRNDIQMDKIGYLGISWGGFLGGILPAVEKRIKVIVLNVGGMEMTKALPEVDQINFLPRITQPVLMLNARYDMYFPVETSQKPMFDLLGTPVENKKIITYESGHLVPRTEFVKETLIWFDRYLGPVK